MNAVLLALTVIFALLATAAAVWAMRERLRAERLEMLAAHTSPDAVRDQAMLAADAAAEALLRRAEESFVARDRLVQAKLEAQLTPVKDTLAKFEAQVAAAETARAAETGGLKTQIEQLLAASTATQEEARKLSQALRRGAGVQGRWGEQMLRNVLEMAGLQAGIDFTEQVHIDADGGGHRPDVVVRLPGEALFVIDAKCSLTAFLEAQDATDETVREAAFVRHAQSLKTHVLGLAARAYWDKLDFSPDFVAMFVPGDGFLAAALERAPDLMNEAMERRVILTTPTTLFALCKAVAYGWRIDKQARSAAHIAELGRELYRRLSVMGDHVQAMGKALDTAVGRYNQFIGSLEIQVLSQGRRFEDLKVDHEGKEIVELSPIETTARPLTKLGIQASAEGFGASVLTAPEPAPTSAS